MAFAWIAGKAYVMALRLLDLFCCAGGAAVGYARAGFDVTGVDVVVRKRYPYTFIQADALDLSPAFLASFDAIHASPPCQGYTAMRHAPGARGAPRMIGVVREMLEATGRPWIIENVEEARREMRDPIMLCGTMFSLGAAGCELRRHRLFESNVPISAPCSCHHSDRPVVGIYGGHARIRSAKHGGRGTRDDWGAGGHRPVAAAAMDMQWASLAEMSEALPPAYTEHLGHQLIAALSSSQAEAA